MMTVDMIKVTAAAIEYCGDVPVVSLKIQEIKISVDPAPPPTLPGPPALNK